MQCAYLLKIRRESHLQNAVSSQQSTLTLTKRLNSIYSKLTSKYVILTNHTILDQQLSRWGQCNLYTFLNAEKVETWTSRYRCVEVIIKLEVPRLQGTGE